MATKRTSRVYTISLPPELALKAEAMAKRSHRTMSELFRESFRVYLQQENRKMWEAIDEYATAHNPMGYTEEDVPRLIKEVRAAEKAKETEEKMVPTHR
jgi:CopG family transcriptional regulator/antitoxin EndoAI